MNVIRWLNRYFEEVLLAIMLVAMTLIMGLQIVMRYVFNNSLSWPEELATFLFVWSTFLSISYCIREKSSIKIEQFYNIMPPKVQKLIKLLSKTIMLILAFFLAWYAYNVFVTVVKIPQTSPAMGIPMYVIYFSAFLGFVLLIIRLIQSYIAKAVEPLPPEGDKVTVKQEEIMR